MEERCQMMSIKLKSSVMKYENRQNCELRGAGGPTLNISLLVIFKFLKNIELCPFFGCRSTLAFFARRGVLESPITLKVIPIFLSNVLSVYAKISKI